MVNEGFAEMAGYAREEIEGRMKWTEIIHPDDHQRLLGYHRLRREDPEKAPKAFECRIVDRQGRPRNMMQRVDLIPGTTTSLDLDLNDNGITDVSVTLATPATASGDFVEIDIVPDDRILRATIPHGKYTPEGLANVTESAMNQASADYGFGITYQTT